MDNLHRFKAEFFKALAHPQRLAILDQLRLGEFSVNSLAEQLNLEPSTVSHQLAILRNRGFVASRKQKTVVYYRVSDLEVYPFLDLGRQVFQRQLARQAALLEETP